MKYNRWSQLHTADQSMRSRWKQKHCPQYLEEEDITYL